MVGSDRIVEARLEEAPVGVADVLAMIRDVDDPVVPICRVGFQLSGPMFKLSTSFTALFASRRPPEKLR